MNASAVKISWETSYETCSYTHTLLQTMQSFSMFPVVNKPTRVYGNSATLIDNIFINNPENNIVSGNIVSDTTDHFSQMCILTSHCKPFFPNNKTKVRDYSTFNAKSFIDDLQNINWNNICKHTDANQSFSRFYKCVNKTINKHAPLRSISNRKQKFLAKPWLTAGLRKSIRVKNNLFYTSDWEKYKFYRNKIMSLKILSKANYYQSFFDLNICNMRTPRVNFLIKDYNYNYMYKNLIKGEKCLLAIFHKRFPIYFSSGNIFFNLVFNSHFKFKTFDVLSNTINCRDTTHFESEDVYRTGCRNISHCQQQQSYSGLRSPGRSNSTYFCKILILGSKDLNTPRSFFFFFFLATVLSPISCHFNRRSSLKQKL